MEGRNQLSRILGNSIFISIDKIYFGNCFSAVAQSIKYLWPRQDETDNGRKKGHDSHQIGDLEGIPEELLDGQNYNVNGSPIIGNNTQKSRQLRHVIGVQLGAQKFEGVLVFLGPLVGLDAGLFGSNDSLYQSFLFTFRQETQTGIVNRGILVGNIPTIEFDTLCKSGNRNKNPCERKIDASFILPSCLLHSIQISIQIHFIGWIQ